MQTSSRPRDYTAGQQRGRHGTHISISDDSHHVTDAISSLYDYTAEQTHQTNPPPSSPQHLGHNQNYNQHQQQQQHGLTSPPSPHDPNQRSSRPLSFLPSAREEIISSRRNNGAEDGSTRRNIVGRSKTMDRPSPSHQTASSREYVVRSNSVPHQHGLPSPPPSGGIRSPADTATASFPLNDIDYESSPAAVAQELSNLQAIRRMSMNVDSASDPDLPTFGVPPASPTGAEDEDDASRLFWVPARLHPELAPTEFKTFLDKKVDQIKRRSGDYSSLSPDGVSRSSSGSSSLQRKKSMLSRQINTDGRGGEGYQDGAERLERKRSASNQSANSGMDSLETLEEIVNDPSAVIRRISLENQNRSSNPDEDMPILPIAPGGNSLKRSTRTHYRRSSVRDRDGKRVPPHRRAAARAAEQAESDAEELSPIGGSNEPPPLPLQRVQTEPIPPPSQISESKDKLAENFSRPGRGTRRVASPPPVQPTNHTASPGVSFDAILHHDNQQQQQQYQPPPERVDSRSPPQVPQAKDLPPATSREPQPFVSSFASNGRSTARVPSIVETPPPQDDSRSVLQQSYRSDMPIPRAGKRQQGQKAEQQTLQHMASHPSPLPGNSTRTDSLSFIPTLPEEKRAEPKKEKDGTKKSSWSWGSLLGNEEKEKEKRKEEEAKEASKKSKFKTGKSNDSTRLDVLQTTMDGGSSSRGRESLVLDRGDYKIDDERQQKSGRKSSETKKEKDGLFSSLFGAGKKKSASDRDSTSNKKYPNNRALSPEPPRPALKPDIDYNWTRFSILEERAIYRMAHIKLANPRRALYSQVLLSNFMYSYLAKVQQMHPQMQIPQNAAQKAQQRAAQQQQKKDQPEEYSQYQRYQEQQDRQDRQSQQQHQPPAANNNHNGGYDDGQQGYGYDHSGNGNNSPATNDQIYSQPGQQQQQQQQPQQHQQQQQGGYNYSSPYGFQQSQFDDPTKSDDDMW